MKSNEYISQKSILWVQTVRYNWLAVIRQQSLLTLFAYVLYKQSFESMTNPVYTTEWRSVSNTWSTC